MVSDSLNMLSLNEESKYSTLQTLVSRSTTPKTTLDRKTGYLPVDEQECTGKELPVDVSLCLS